MGHSSSLRSLQRWNCPRSSGEAQSTFRELLGSAGYPGVIEQQEHLDQALPLARRLAEQLNCQAVLLSPACASFDQYRDFEVRGDHFRQLVEAMA